MTALLDRLPRLPRFVPRHDRLTLSPGWYRNRKTGVLHFVWDSAAEYYTATNHQAVGAPGIDQRHLEPIKPAALFDADHRFSARRYSIDCERSALAMMQAGKYPQALQFLMKAIQLPFDEPPQKKPWPAPCIRLYDLLAGAAVFSGNQEALNRLVELTEGQLTQHPARFAQPGSKVFRARLTKWNEPDGKWHARLKAADKFTWSGVVLPRSGSG
jgi:hypothetical protein